MADRMVPALHLFLLSFRFIRSSFSSPLPPSPPPDRSPPPSYRKNLKLLSSSDEALSGFVLARFEFVLWNAKSFLMSQFLMLWSLRFLFSRDAPRLFHFAPYLLLISYSLSLLSACCFFFLLFCSMIYLLVCFFFFSSSVSSWLSPLYHSLCVSLALSFSLNFFYFISFFITQTKGNDILLHPMCMNAVSISWLRKMALRKRDYT